jgi:hypothetical protein
LANEAMGPSFQGGWCFVRRPLPTRKLLSELSEGIRRHFDKYPLTSVKQLAKYFCTFVVTIMHRNETSSPQRHSSRKEIDSELCH